MSKISKTIDERCRILGKTFTKNINEAADEVKRLVAEGVTTQYIADNSGSETRKISKNTLDILLAIANKKIHPKFIMDRQVHGLPYFDQEFLAKGGKVEVMVKTAGRNIKKTLQIDDMQQAEKKRVFKGGRIQTYQEQEANDLPENISPFRSYPEATPTDYRGHLYDSDNEARMAVIFKYSHKVVQCIPHPTIKGLGYKTDFLIEGKVGDRSFKLVIESKPRKSSAEYRNKFDGLMNNLFSKQVESDPDFVYGGIIIECDSTHPKKGIGFHIVTRHHDSIAGEFLKGWMADIVNARSLAESYRTDLAA